MKKFVVVIALVIFLAACSLQNKDAQATRPNIVFIMSDDHAYQAISSYDTTLIHTPNIDRIAENGIRFTNACVANSICAPSRATILTGLHSHLNGKIDNWQPFDTTNITFPQILQENGYQTAMFGKLHFGNSPKGVDRFMILPGQGHYYNPDFITNEGDTTIEGYTTDVITDLTLEWLEKDRKKDEPFMLMYLHKAPHREWFPPERYYTEYLDKTFPEPPTLHDDYAGRGTAAREAEMNILEHMNWGGDTKINHEVLEELGIKEQSDWGRKALEYNLERMTEGQREAWHKAYGPVNQELLETYPSMTEEEKMEYRYQRYMQDYLASVAAVDENVGRVLDYLEQNGLMENTIVVYTSDQGFYLGEHGWFDKRFIYDESFLTPLLVQWNGVIEPGTVNDEMVQNLDFAQTFLDAADIPAPEQMQGESLVPLLKGDVDAWDRDEVYYHYYEYPAVHMVKRHYGIVTQEYKLAHFYYDIDEWELYDRKNDPLEMNNEYDNPAYADVVMDLKERLNELRKKYKDSEELDQKFIDVYKEHGRIK